MNSVQASLTIPKGNQVPSSLERSADGKNKASRIAANPNPPTVTPYEMENEDGSVAVNPDPNVPVPEEDGNPYTKADEIADLFLSLLVAQINYQNPLDPMDSSEYISQMAQFASVTELEAIRVGQQALYLVGENQLVMSTTQLVGRDVMAPGDMVDLVIDEPKEGQYYLDKDYDNVTIKLFDEVDTEVGSVSLGAQLKGKQNFELDLAALNLPEGRYRVEAQTRIGEEEATTDTFFRGRVESVVLRGSEGLMLNVKDMGEVPLFDISEIVRLLGEQSDGDSASSPESEEDAETQTYSVDPATFSPPDTEYDEIGTNPAYYHPSTFWNPFGGNR